MCDQFKYKCYVTETLQSNDANCCL